MATLRNKRKLAAVSRETPESTRNSRGQNTLDPDLTQDYISQVSEKIEGRVTKKLSEEFSRTESRILGALSKLDEFLLNPQVRTCSVGVPGTSRNNNSENQETTRDHSSDDPCPERGYSAHSSGQIISPEPENNPHRSLLPLSIQDFSEFKTGDPWSFLMVFIKNLDDSIKSSNMMFVMKLKLVLEDIKNVFEKKLFSLARERRKYPSCSVYILSGKNDKYHDYSEEHHNEGRFSEYHDAVVAIKSKNLFLLIVKYISRKKDIQSLRINKETFLRM